MACMCMALILPPDLSTNELRHAAPPVQGSELVSENGTALALSRRPEVRRMFGGAMHLATLQTAGWRHPNRHGRLYVRPTGWPRASGRRVRTRSADTISV